MRESKDHHCQDYFYHHLPSSSALPPGAFTCIDFLSDVRIHSIDLAETFRQIHHRTTANFQFTLEKNNLHHLYNPNYGYLITPAISTTQLSSSPSSSHSSNSTLTTSSNENILSSSSSTHMDHPSHVISTKNCRCFESSHMSSNSSSHLQSSSASWKDQDRKSPTLKTCHLLPPSTCIYRLKNVLWRRWWIEKYQTNAISFQPLRVKETMDPKPLLCPLFLNNWDQEVHSTDRIENSLHSSSPYSLDSKHSPVSSFSSPNLFVKTGGLRDPCLFDHDHEKNKDYVLADSTFSTYPETPYLPTTTYVGNVHLHNESYSSSSNFQSTPYKEPSATSPPQAVSQRLKGILKKHTQMFSMADIIQFAKILKQRGCSTEQRRSMLLSAWEIDRPPATSNSNSSHSQSEHNQYHHSSSCPLSNCSSSQRNNLQVSIPSSTGICTPLLVHSPSIYSDSDEEMSDYFDCFPNHEPSFSSYTTFSSSSTVSSTSPSSTSSQCHSRRSPSLVCFHWKVEQCIIVDPPPPPQAFNLRKDSKMENEFQDDEQKMNHQKRSNVVQTIKPISATVLKADSSVLPFNLDIQSGPSIVKTKPSLSSSIYTRPEQQQQSSQHKQYSRLTTESMLDMEQDDDDDGYAFEDPFPNWLTKEGVIQDTIQFVQESTQEVIETGLDIYHNARDIFSVAKSAVRHFLFF